MLQALTSHKVPIRSLSSVYHGRRHEVVLGILQRFLFFLFLFSVKKRASKSFASHPDNMKKSWVNCNSKTVLEPSENLSHWAKPNTKSGEMRVYMKKQSLNVTCLWSFGLEERLRWKLLTDCYRIWQRYECSGEHRERGFMLLLRLFLQEPIRWSQERPGDAGWGERAVRKPSLWCQMKDEKSSLYQNPPGSSSLAPLKNKSLNLRGKDNKIVIGESWWQLLPAWRKEQEK